MSVAFVPPDVGNDDHVIRRLGWAVVRQWAHLPSDVQERILSQAIFVDDEYKTVQLQEQIRIFVREHSAPDS